MEEIKVGILGYGGIAELHVQKMKEVGGFRLVAVCDVDAGSFERARRQNKDIACYDDLIKFLGVGMDLVVIATPHDLHASQAVEVLERGKHVVVEKPMCMRVEEADRMIEASERNKVMLTVFQNRRWDNDFLTVKKVIDDGLLGKVFSIQSRVMGWGSPGGWRLEPQHGGMLYDWGAHLVDQIFQMVGYEVERVEGYARCIRHKAVDYFKIILYFKGGVVGEVEGSHVAGQSLPRWLVLGSEGGLVTVRGWGEMEINKRVDGKEEKMVPRVVEADWGAFYENVRDVLMTGKELMVKPGESREVIRALETVWASGG